MGFWFVVFVVAIVYYFKRIATEEDIQSYKDAVRETVDNVLRTPAKIQPVPAVARKPNIDPIRGAHPWTALETYQREFLRNKNATSKTRGAACLSWEPFHEATKLMRSALETCPYPTVSRVYFRSGGKQNTEYRQILPANVPLLMGDSVISESGQYGLYNQDDGQLVLYHRGDPPFTGPHYRSVWSSGNRIVPQYFVVQDNGNPIQLTGIPGHSGSVSWRGTDRTNGTNKPYVLHVSDDGIMTVREAHGNMRVAWSSQQDSDALSKLRKDMAGRFNVAKDTVQGVWAGL